MQRHGALLFMPNKTLELTGMLPSGSRRWADNSDTVDLIRACSSTLCYGSNTGDHSSRVVAR